MNLPMRVKIFCFDVFVSETCQTFASLLLMVLGMWYCLVIRQNYEKIEILSCNLIEILSCNLIEILSKNAPSSGSLLSVEKNSWKPFCNVTLLCSQKSQYQRKSLFLQNQIQELPESHHSMTKHFSSLFWLNCCLM